MPSEVSSKRTVSVGPSQTTTKKVDVLKLCKWAKKNGAVQIKVDGIEILFPPPELEASSQFSNEAITYGVPPQQKHPWLAETVMPEAATVPPATVKPRPAINSEGDHPDVYARELDAWANQRPLGRR